MFRDMFTNRVNNKETKIVQNLDAETFEKMIEEDEKAILLDVRTPMEHEMQRIPNSILIDIYSPAFTSEIDKLDRSKNYYIYCRSGNRSYHAGNQMLKMGFEKVSHLQPGIIGWSGKTEQEDSNY